MATINIYVQSLLNTAVYDLQIVDTAGTIGELKTAMETNFSYSASWFDLVFNNQVLNTAQTIGSYGIVEGSRLRTHNKIARLATKELRQKAKLDLAALDRAAGDDNLRSTYDLTTLPTQYNDNSIINNPNAGGLIEGRPWRSTVPAFTFYEAFNTTVALSTTQYVSGNKIYAYSSTYDTPGFQPARVVVNDIEVLNRGESPYGRGHNLVVLDSYGDVVTPAAQYDTYINIANATAVASALNAVAVGNIVVLVVYDASAVNAALRSAINTGYGSTNSNTWTADRKSHIFIGIKS